MVYEHFGGKEGLYAVVVDREMRWLLELITSALSAAEHPRELLEQAALALLGYIQDSSDGFRILVRDLPVATEGGSFSSRLGEIARRVEHILGRGSPRGTTTPSSPRCSASHWSGWSR